MLKNIPALSQDKDLLKKAQYKYSSTITDATKSDTLTLPQLLAEAIMLKLIRFEDAQEHTSTSIKDLYGSVQELGVYPFEVKLTKAGAAHVTLGKQAKSLIKSTDQQDNASPTELKDPLFMLIIVKPEESTILIPSATDLHLNVIKHYAEVSTFDPSTHTYKSIGFLTSEISNNDKLAEIRFKEYQDGLQGNKKQYFHRYHNIKEIPSANAYEVAGGIEYLQNHCQSAPLEEAYVALKTKPCEPYSNNGLTDEGLLDLCKLAIACQKKGIFPLTDDQIKLNEENKLKQSEESKKKKVIPLTENNTIDT